MAGYWQLDGSFQFFLNNWQDLDDRCCLLLQEGNSIKYIAVLTGIETTPHLAQLATIFKLVSSFQSVCAFVSELSLSNFCELLHILATQ